MAGELTVEVERLIERHRAIGIAPDTNLLLLWIIGSCDPEMISRHKRTPTFAISDYQILENLLSRCGRWNTTPNVMTETANLLMQTDGALQRGLLSEFSQQAFNVRESYYRSSELVTVPHFPALRLTDASLLRAAQRGRLIVSCDFRLCGLITAGGGAAINFNHLRSIS